MIEKTQISSMRTDLSGDCAAQRAIKARMHDNAVLALVSPFLTLVAVPPIAALSMDLFSVASSGNAPMLADSIMGGLTFVAGGFSILVNCINYVEGQNKLESLRATCSEVTGRGWPCRCGQTMPSYPAPYPVG